MAATVPTSYRGIRYASAERFAPPQPVPFDPDAVTEGARGPVPPQNVSTLKIITGYQDDDFPQSEDCLHLTVTTPAREGKRPVMVYIHGGAYMIGGGELPCFDADDLVAEQDVVFVAISYRLGAFGYLRRPGDEGPSLGLQDQAMALQWVQDNIAHFGGDPDNVTAFGHSAGAHSIDALAQFGHGGKLFHRAIFQSRPKQDLMPNEKAREVYDTLLGFLDGKDPAEVDMETLKTAQGQTFLKLKSIMPFAPVTFDTLPERSKPYDAITGYTRHDVRPFVLRTKPNAMLRMFGPVVSHVANSKVFGKGAEEASDRAATFGGTVATYRLNWGEDLAPYGACHCIELPLLFDNEESWKGTVLVEGAPAQEQATAGKAIRALWAAFARGEDPTTMADESKALKIEWL